MLNGCTINLIVINLKVINEAEAQQNETFRGWYKVQKRNTTPFKINGSKNFSSFDKLGNEPDKSSNSGIQKALH